MSEGFNRVRVLWPDHLGLARGKYVPASMAERGTHHCTGTWALGYDRGMTPETVGSHWNEGLPDFEATYDMADLRPSWESNTRVVVADLERNGEPVSVAPRTALRKAVADWRELGYEPQVGMEFEAFVFAPDGDGGWVPLDTPGAFVYGTGPSVDPHGLVDQIWQACEQSDIPLESVNSEYDSPQFEFTIRYADALRAADEGFLFKVLAREVAHRMGLLVTFMGKPLSDRGGSGLHINFSFADGTGANVINDPAQPDGISVLAKNTIGGLLSHHQGLAGLCAPTVNAYKRLRPASLSGYWANWGYDHRGATIRIPGERGAAARLEHRLSDGAAVVHTAVAAVLQASLLGVRDTSDPGPSEGGNGLDTIEATVGVPASLADALDALERDHDLVEAVGADLVAQHVAVKRAEWERYTAATTDWELREYLPFL
ncbi:MAG TPA: glutamine synthetase family protein [Acidimicrobiales bacterium]|nr:glutamine synthetase family protein [Acidimicrobiales bacterium]